MPRVALTAEQRLDYMLADLPFWFEKEARKRKLHTKDLADALGITRQAWSERKKPGADGRPKDPFSYGDMLILFRFLQIPEYDRIKIMTLL